MTNLGRRATLFSILANSVLFCLKFTVGMISGSLALLSDAMNSFSDTVYSIAIYIAVKLSGQKADADHPFGHHRAEPIAGLLIAMLAGILGAEIIKTGIMGIVEGATYSFSLLAVAVLAFTMGLKSFMWLYFRTVAKTIRSPAIAATSIDCRNDVLVSFIAMLGVSSSFFNLPSFDSYAAIAIGLFILHSGYKIGIENIDYLMGKTPNKEVLDEITKKTLAIPGVKGVHDIKAHYVGNFIHVQIHIEVSKDLKATEAHDIGDLVQKAVERMPSVDRAFVHIDPKR